MGGQRLSTRQSEQDEDTALEESLIRFMFESVSLRLEVWKNNVFKWAEEIFKRIDSGVDDGFLSEQKTWNDFMFSLFVGLFWSEFLHSRRDGKSGV